MDVISEVRAEREDLARVLKKYDGIRRVVEDLYPDSVHFIYELLQNAEDTGATNASFTLTAMSLVFEHNGRSFSKADIEGITNIGEGSKHGDDEQIGRFGVGFKAVFAYSETPKIWSPTFSFMISELVLPNSIDPFPGLGGRTRFEFPFNNPKKDPAVAFAEVGKGLNDIAETTLLFLSHLESISWQIENGPSGEVLRVQYSEVHFETLKQFGGEIATSAHFLKFDEPVEALNNRQRVALAFALEYLPNVEKLDSAVALAKQVRIFPSVPGRVAVFFPAEKETSGLRFHLHAPFVPELSRASIKETPANAPLFEQLAKLTAASLHKIRDLGLLTMDVLAVLPNPQDAIPARYECIRQAIIKEMNVEALTPTNSRKHAPATRLLQAKADLKRLLSEDDLEVLIENDEDSPLWAVAATQRNSNADRFLAGLSIRQWDVGEFVELIADKAPQYGEPDPAFTGWLSGKSVEWHQQLYSLLYKELQAEGRTLFRLRNRPIIRLGDGGYSAGTGCFFADETGGNDDGLRRVDPGVYSSGRSEIDQRNARKLLEDLGVREVGEADQIEAILRERYVEGALKPRKQDLKRFINLVAKQPDKAKLFSKYFIFEGADGYWHKPSGIFLDAPFGDTGLTAWYSALGKDAKRIALQSRYEDAGVKREDLASFAEAVGAQTRLTIEQKPCSDNPLKYYLFSVGGDRYTYSIDQDFYIPGLEQQLMSPTLALAKLIWSTMSSLPKSPNHLLATYQKNETWGARHADSLLVHHLRNATWIPQGDAVFVRPMDAVRDQLPAGFPLDPSWPWLKAVHFAVESDKKTELGRQKRDIANQLGFRDDQSLERAKRFASLPAAEQERFLEDAERRRPAELPDHESSHPQQRADRLRAQATDAPPKRSEERTRSVSVGRDNVKKEAAQYLQQQYTNAQGVMICQVCKDRLPFLLDDGSYYFEAVEFLPDTTKWHYQNYLALCPNHAAMYQHANGSANSLRELLLRVADNVLDIELAQQRTSVYFTKIHLADLKVLLGPEQPRAASEGE